MPDDRLFNKSLGHSEKLSVLTDFEDLVWRGYVLSADDFGVMRFSALTLQADHDRFAKRSQKVVQRALERVRDVGLILTFEHQNRVYCFQHDWQERQKLTYPKRTIQPRPPAALLGVCKVHTLWLFSRHPDGGKLPSWKAPTGWRPDNELISSSVQETLRKDSSVVRELVPKDSSSVRARAGEYTHTDTSTNTQTGRGAGETNRVQAFVDRYRELHEQYCGVAYLGNPATDYENACRLVEAFDDDLLEKLTVYWLNDKGKFATDGTRTIAKFRSRASGYAEELKARRLA